MANTQTSSDNNPNNPNRIFKCCGLGCENKPIYKLKVIWIGKSGWFCDKCAKDLLNLQLVEVVD